MIDYPVVLTWDDSEEDDEGFIEWDGKSASAMDTENLEWIL